MGYIYKITNLINNKIYVGQTRFEVKERFKEHLWAAKRGIKYPLYSAIRKYGENNFKIEIIEEIEDSLLNEREKFWIEKLNTFIKNQHGYNATYGGEGNSIIDKNEIYKLWDEKLSIQEIANMTNHDRSSIRKILQNYENYSIEESNARGDQIQAKNRFKKILQYSLNGKYIATFNNMTEAERQTGISHKNIWNNVQHMGDSAGGFQWRFEDDATPVLDMSKKRIKRKKVKQIDNFTQNVIEIYDSVKQASIKTNISYNRIYRCCRNNTIMQPENYRWEYIEEGR